MSSCFKCDPLYTQILSSFEKCRDLVLPSSSHDSRLHHMTALERDGSEVGMLGINGHCSCPFFLAESVVPALWCWCKSSPPAPPAGHERTHADHRLAFGRGLCGKLVWKGEVSTQPADFAGLDAFFQLAESYRQICHLLEPFPVEH